MANANLHSTITVKLQLMAEIFVAPRNSSNQNSGTIESPLATIQAAHNLAKPGDTIYLRGGTYNLKQKTTTVLTKNGTKAAPIRLHAYQNERPILDASSWTRKKSVRDSDPQVIYHSGDFWHVKGLEIKGSPSLGYTLSAANNNVLENLNIHHNDNTGLAFFKNSSNNTILGGDFHHNFDRINNGQDADGIGIKFGDGKGNVINGARAYNNADDGIDLWEFKGDVTIKNTWAYGNGIDRWNLGSAFEGNGNGFKLSGGRGINSASNKTDLAHIVRNNLAWENGRRGFDYNGSLGSMTVENNTGYNNDVNFLFSSGTHKLRNNLSFSTKFEGFNKTGGKVADTNNSWTLPRLNVSRDDFLSLDDTIAKGERAADGSLPQSDFLRLRKSSNLIDAGTKVGNDFLGSAPDLGAYEFGDYEFEGKPVASSRPTNIVVDYDFEIVNGNIVFDEVAQGGNNAGKLYNAVYKRKNGNRVVAFDGDDRVAIPNSEAINLGIHRQRTVSFWFNPSNLTLDTQKQVLYEEGGSIRGLNAYIDKDRLYVGGWNKPQNESGWAGTWLKSDQLEAGKWHHLAIVLDGAKTVSSNALNGYLNGEAFGSGEGSQLWSHKNGVGLGNVNQSTLFHDGVGTGNHGFAGSIDSFELSNSAANDEQIQAWIL